MAEKTENTETDVTEETTSTEEVVKTDKKFNQTEVNALIQNRVKREKDALIGLKTEWETEKTELTQQIEKYEAIISKTVEEKMALLDAPTQKLLKKLSVLEQLEFLGDDANFAETPKKKIPTTPQKSDSSNDKKAQKPRFNLP
jgi:hypothetical protein